MKKIFLSTMSLVMVLSLITSPVLAQDMGGNKPPASGLAEHVPGELLIRFSPGLDSAGRADKMAVMGVIHKREIQAIGVQLVRLPAGLSVEQAVARFNRMPGVEFAEPNYILHIAQAPQAEIVDQWGLDKMRITDAWAALGAGEKSEVLIATVDSGVDKNRSDLSAQIWTLPGETAGNGQDDDGNGYVDDTWGWDFVNNDNDPMDDNMHGTAVSSVMVAAEDGVGMVGVCPWCKVMAVKVINNQGSGSLDVVANGIVYAAENGAQVINLSLGAASGAQTLEDAVNFAWGEGAVVVAAAGNNGTNMVLYPAGYANAIPVASTNAEDKHSCFSNYGEGYISVAAPGEAIYVIDINNTETGYGTYSGTSLATPHVSGLAGLLLGKDPGLTNADVRSILEESAVDLGSPGVDGVFGHGRIDAYRAVMGDFSQVAPPDSLSSTSDTATGFSHARKLVRDSTGKLHVIWHTYDGSLYRIRYATSSDDGASWALQPDVFSSPYETYHSALAADAEFLYVAIPSRQGVDLPYQIVFTRKSLAEGVWSPVEAIISGNYHAVRPGLFVDPTNGRLHVIASSLDDTPYLYYRASDTQGSTWGTLRQFNPSNTTSNKTSQVAFYAHGDHLYVVTRTVEPILFTLAYLNIWTTRSINGGETWIDQTQFAANFPFLPGGNSGISLAGVGDRVYMGYVVGFDLYFRRNDGTGWSDYLTLETSDGSNPYKWPSITQSAGGQAWMLFELSGLLYRRYYDGSTWQAKEIVGPGTYPNLKLGTGADRVEWVSTTCNGSPFDIAYGSLGLGQNLPPQAEAQSISTNEDKPVNITLTGSDPENAPLTYSVDTGPSHGTLSGAAPALTYSPNLNYYGSDSFTFVANDGQADSPPATVSITVTPINDPPIANSFSVSTPQDTPLGITLTGSDPDFDPLTYSVVTGPSHGTLSGGAPNLTYTPAAGYSGADSFSFRAHDSQSDSAPATVSITITPVIPPLESMHVSDLDAEVASQPKNQWSATVTITVHDASDAPVDGVLVAGSWSAGASGTVTCTTGVDGKCYVGKSNLKGNLSSVTFTINNLTHATLAYDSSANHDLDGDSYAGTTIIVYKNGPPANHPPLAAFTYTCDVFSCTFDASGSADADGVITNYIWDFGDGFTGGGVTPDHLYGAQGTYTVVLTVLDDQGASSSSSQQVYAGDLQLMHVGDLDGSSASGSKSRWNATVSILVHNDNEVGVAGVTVSGSWSTGASSSCTTDNGGWCSIPLDNLSSRTTSVNFSVNDLIKSGWAFDPIMNTDPDGDSNGTLITISR